MKRRQIQFGSPFEEAQSILGDPLWLVNYAIQVPHQPISDPPKPTPQVLTTVHKELIQPEEVDFREMLLQDNSQNQSVPPPPEIEKSTKTQQQSKAQQLIQQSQQLLQRRRQPKVQEEKQQKAKQLTHVNSDEQQSNILPPQVEQRPPPIQEFVQPIFAQPIQEKVVEVPPQPLIKKQSEKIVQPIIEQPKQINKQQQQPSAVIHAQSFYHGLATYNLQSGQFNKLTINSLASSYPGPFFKNRSQDNQRALRYFWNSYSTNNTLLQLAIDHLEKPLDKNSAIHIIESKILNDQSGSAFVEAYDRISKQQDWETKLLLNILNGEYINIKQQGSLIEYIKKRAYHDDQEAWLIRLAVLLKMTPVDQNFNQELQLQLQHLYSNEQIQARLLWLLLKLDVQNTQVEEFLLSYFTKFNYNYCHSEIQILLGDSHAFFHNQANADLYYKLGLLFVEAQSFDKALECAKFAIDLGCLKARDLRERILQVLELKEKSKGNNNSGLLGYFGQAVNAVKNIKQQQPATQAYTPQPQNFYYDKELKAYVINGVPQSAEEEPKKEVVAPPAPPPPRRKFEQPKPMVVEDQEEHQVAQIADDPFQSQQVGNSEQNKKKNNLLRNRYVQ